MDLDGFDDVGFQSPAGENTGTAEGALAYFDARWYRPRTRLARWMDLQGDYAGNELFVIDGESLLQIVLDDPLLAIGRAKECSFQMPHAYHLLEKTVLEFVSRSANFEIVFFHKYRHLTLRTGDDNFVVASRMLARTLLFKHLLKLKVPVHVFEDLEDQRWIHYDATNKPMFILMNDGGSSDHSSTVSAARVLAQRRFVYNVLSGHTAMALLKGTVYSDSKISTFVYEPTRASDRSLARLQSQMGLDDIISELTGRVRAHLGDLITPAVPDPSRLILKICIGLLKMSSTPTRPHLVYIFLIHWFHLPQLSLEDRAQLSQPGQPPQLFLEFLEDLFYCSADLLASHPGDHYEFDGRVFLSTISFILSHPSRDLQQVVGQEVHDLVEQVWRELRQKPFDATQLIDIIPAFPPVTQPSRSPIQRLLPFSNPIFDRFLPQITQGGERSDDTSDTQSFFGTGTLFSDTQHWHNQRSILPPHLGGSAAQPKLTGRAYTRKLRSEQIFMYNMQLQAATITGASGTILRQQVIPPVGDSWSLEGKPVSTSRRIKAAPPIPQPRPAAKGKKGKAVQLSSKEALLKKIQEGKEDQVVEASRSWWKEKLASFSKLTLTDKKNELDILFRNKRAEERMLGMEMRFYRLHLIVQLWAEQTEPANPQVHDEFSVAVFKSIKDICDRKVLTAAWHGVLSTLIKCLGFERYLDSMLGSMSLIDDVKPSFKFAKLVRSSGKQVYDFLSIGDDPVRWQLRLFGEFMDRSMDSAPDRRVPFEPDAWQRKVLDCIDQDNSILVVAPTSAGKTFISFYAMEQALRSSDHGVIVYVAPTKALVTQITAEIYARFSKQLNGKTCWAIHTRDYRINDPQKCQILVTVPEVLAIMLLSPTMATSWTPKIKRIILDEIHSIGQQEGGAVWEQILLMAPCPIIGLSATIGSPERFNEWLASVQNAHGFQHTFIQHPHRYSHLRKFFYTIPDGDAQSFTSLEEHQSTNNMKFLHPMGTLSFGRSTIPDDLALEARDTLSLCDALYSLRSQITNEAIRSSIEELQPALFFAKTNHPLRQKDVLEYEEKLKRVLTDMSNEAGATRETLMQVVRRVQDPDLVSMGDAALSQHPNRERFFGNLIHLVADLHVRGDLPAIIFNFNRTECELIARHLNSQLVEAEEEWKSTSPKWKRKMAQWDAWKLASKEREKAAQRAGAKGKKKKTSRGDDDGEGNEGPGAAAQQDGGAASSSWEQSFDPHRPLPQFSFINYRSTYTVTELEEDIAKQKWRLRAGSKLEWAYACLRRGIAIHHAGMNKQYRSLVESLFRRGFIRIIIATGTLALGINAPAKTSIFCNDSPFLTALMYRQCAGRAGRRGYDLLGNVIFYGIPLDRVQRLILSKLPTLGGGFPVTSTLVLRLCNLLEQSKREDKLNKGVFKRNEGVVKAIEALLSLPRVSFVSEAGRDHLVHHIRFSIDYLRRSGLLDETGQAMNLFAVAGHLYYTEPSNLALVALMRSGVLHTICSDPNLESAKRTYILLMCHLFGRRYLRRIEVSAGELEMRRKKYPSRIVLPPLPEPAVAALKTHSTEIVRTFVGYALAYAEEKGAELGATRARLPLSGLDMNGSTELSEGGTGGTSAQSEPDAPPAPLTAHLRASAIRTTARSPFVATSGLDDTFSSVQELANTVCNGIHLNAHAIPCIDHILAGASGSIGVDDSSNGNGRGGDSDDDDAHVLNAYLYDFYVHGQSETLVNANGIRRGDLWYLLEDFRLTLMTVRAALQQLLGKASREQEGLGEDAAADETWDGGEEGNGLDGLTEEESAELDGSGGGGDDDDEEEWGIDEDFKRPSKVTDADWRVYMVVSKACAEFGIKAQAMWA